MAAGIYAYLKEEGGFCPARTHAWLAILNAVTQLREGEPKIKKKWLKSVIKAVKGQKRDLGRAEQSIQDAFAPYHKALTSQSAHTLIEQGVPVGLSDEMTQALSLVHYLIYLRLDKAQEASLLANEIRESAKKSPGTVSAKSCTSLATQ